jgi:hypothetical protein
LLVRSFPKFQAKDGTDIVGMRDDALNVNLTTVERIGTSKPRCHAHGVTDVRIAELRIKQTGWQTELAERFMGSPGVSLANYVHCSNDWIKTGIGDATELPNGDIVFALVETESDVDLKNVVESHAEKTKVMIQEGESIRWP